MYSILLVDDEKAIREYLPKAIPFEEHGFKVIDTAMNGQEATEKLSSVKPDLILLDIRMPVMDGLQFLRNLREGEFSDTFVVMLSGYSDFTYAKEAMKYGVQDYLNKPVDENEIINLLEKMSEKLEENNKKLTIELVRKRVNQLISLYNGEAVDRNVFKDYTLMTCVLLPGEQSKLNGASNTIMQQCLSVLLGDCEDYFFRSAGCNYTFLLPPGIYERFNNSKKAFADELMRTFKEQEIDCSLFFDSYIFDKQEKNFKKDFSDHINKMSTYLFFSPTDFVDYSPKQFNFGEELNGKIKLIEEIREHFLSHNKAQLLEAVEKLWSGIWEVHLEIQFVQEVSYRLYYMIVDELTAIDSENVNIEGLRCPQCLETSHFVAFDKWKEMLLKLISEGITLIEERSKIANLGVTGEAIEYVKSHYMEQISLKDIADKLFVNAAYLGRAFQKATGVSFKKYLNNIRIGEAKKLLLNTNKLIYEIATEVGYTESKYFISKFSEEVGKSPTEYRNQQQSV